MIISASRRTDIPAYYFDWFLNRIKEGFVLVRNPMNEHQISRISLSAGVVDGIVFWTKNPVPMLGKLEALEPYPYYIQFTLNAYGTDMEPFVPSKRKVLVPAFQELSRLLGKDRIVWRYDPILLNKTYTISYHCRYFKTLAKILSPFTNTCIISFFDHYEGITRDIRAPFPDEIPKLAGPMSAVAAAYGLSLKTCAEPFDLKEFGISHAHCIDLDRLERISGWRLDCRKDPNQRPECGCYSSIDIGAYNTCHAACQYCYASHNPSHIPHLNNMNSGFSPLLCSDVTTGDRIRERPIKSCRDFQTSLF